MTKHSILGVNVAAATYETALASVFDAVEQQRAYAVSALAVHGVMTGALDPAHRVRLNRLALVVPDGQPVRWALRWLYSVRLPDRVYGPELMSRLCSQAALTSTPVFFYGSTDETLAKLVENLKRKLPNLIIAGTECSKFRAVDPDERDSIISRIKASGARLVFVGLGCPKQECWAYENAPRLAMPVIAVGAAFAFEAGLLAQAPRSLQRLGLEWLFRLCAEPTRLWRRYLYLNPLYLLMIAAQKTQLLPRTPDIEPSEQRFA